MILFDAAILSLAIDPRSRIPSDFRTGKLIPEARERVDALIEGLERDGDVILIPAPALAEALTALAEKAVEMTEQIENRSCFRIKAFGKREAIEIAIRTHDAILAGDKREGVEEPWQKVKYDRQIIAIAKTENVTAIYSTDEGVHKHAKLWGIPVLHLADVTLPSVTGPQQEMFDETEPTAPISAPTEVPGGSAGPTPGEAGAETTKQDEASQGKQATGAAVGTEEIVPTVPAKSEAPASVQPAGDAKSGS